MSAKPKQPKIGPYPVPQETMDLLAVLQRAVRDAYHGPPSKGLLLSALIYAASTDGERIETEILGPYRRDHPDQDQPR